MSTGVKVFPDTYLDSVLQMAGTRAMLELDEVEWAAAAMATAANVDTLLAQERLDVGRRGHGRRRPLDPLDVEHGPGAGHLQHRVEVRTGEHLYYSRLAHEAEATSGLTRTIRVPVTPSRAEVVPCSEA